MQGPEEPPCFWSVDIMPVLATVSSSYPLYRADPTYITHPSAARQASILRKRLSPVTARTLHVLGLPPAFNLSHDQTFLQLKVFDAPKEIENLSSLFII